MHLAALARSLVRSPARRRPDDDDDDDDDDYTPPSSAVYCRALRCGELHYKPTAVLTGKRARGPSAGARARVRERRGDPALPRAYVRSRDAARAHARCGNARCAVDEGGNANLSSLGMRCKASFEN